MGWKTQDSCQVKFDKLPEANKKVVLAVAQAIINELSKLGFIRVEDIEINRDKLTNILWTKLPGGLQNVIKLANTIVKTKMIVRLKENKK